MPKNKKRLDEYLVEAGYFNDAEEVKRAVIAHEVRLGTTYVNSAAVMIELDDGVRLQRALNREKKQLQPKYEEMCRRFLADSEDFSDEKLKEAGITGRFNNENLKECLNEITEYLLENL